MKRLACVLLLGVLAGCVSIAKVEKGDRAIGSRMNVVIEGPWNHVNAPGMGPAETWTMEGLPVDQLLLYSGLKDGEAIHSTVHVAPNFKRFNFRASMHADEIVSLFEGMLTRDGSRFKLTRLAPVDFAGQKGFRFDYTLTRKVDNVELAGLGYGAVSKGELFAIVYMAPQLTFFARHKARVEQMASAARLKD
jgi:hypothetical protein